jgi:hypothetical protein
LIPVLGVLVSAYIVVRMLELVGRDDRSDVVRFLAGVVMVGGVLGIAYFVWVGSGSPPLYPTTGRGPYGDSTLIITDTTGALGPLRP